MAKLHHQNCTSNDNSTEMHPFLYSLQKNPLITAHANNNTNMLFTNANHAL